jgi:2-polyprenyl-3-methyl-5-hydroxy-6-metoxy-1,4-benzoquinol methylase
MLKKMFTNRQISILIIGPGKNPLAKDLVGNGLVKSIDFVDHNQESIDYQKDLLKDVQVPLKFIKGELSKENPLVEFQAIYDVIICTEVIEHVRNDIELIKAIHAFLDSNGVAIMSVPNGWIDIALMRFDKKYMNDENKNTGHVNFYSPQKLYKIFEENGFDFLMFKKIGSEYTFFHLLIALSKIPINGDTGQIYPDKNRLSHKIALKISEKSMHWIVKYKIDSLLNMIIPRNLYFILKKKKSTEEIILSNN